MSPDENRFVNMNIASRLTIIFTKEIVVDCLAHHLITSQNSTAPELVILSWRFSRERVNYFFWPAYSASNKPYSQVLGRLKKGDTNARIRQTVSNCPWLKYDCLSHLTHILDGICHYLCLIHFPLFITKVLLFLIFYTNTVFSLGYCLNSPGIVDSCFNYQLISSATCGDGKWSML